MPLAVFVRKLSVYFQPFRHSSFLECALQPKVAKINKPLVYLGNSGSLKVIDLDATKCSSLVLVVWGSIPVVICNRFHKRLANNGKITTYRGTAI